MPDVQNYILVNVFTIQTRPLQYKKKLFFESIKYDWVYEDAYLF